MNGLMSLPSDGASDSAPSRRPTLHALICCVPLVIPAMLAVVSEPSDRLEPYQELQGEILYEAIRVLQAWAARQRRPWRPFAETIDGAKLRPRDLLVQDPPPQDD